MKLVETGSLPIDMIQVGKRVRQLDEAWAQGLAAMFQQSPMQNPVQLMKVGNELRLVAGRHRLRAYQINGWTDIPAKVYEPETDNPEAELELAEIDENLGRNELNVLDRAASIAKRQQLLKTLHGEQRGGDRKSEKIKAAKFAGLIINAEIASQLDLSERTIRAAVEMWNGLSAASRKRVSGTWLAGNHVQLKQISELDAEQQHKVLDLILAEEPKARKVADAVCILEKRPKPATDHGKMLAKLVKAWESAPAKVRKDFLAHLEGQGWSITRAKDAA